MEKEINKLVSDAELAGLTTQEVTESDLSDVASQEDMQKVKELLDQHSEEVELSDEEKEVLMREEYIKQLKESVKVFKPITHDGKVTTNKFGEGYKQHRKRRNSLAKKTRNNNRKK
jgi:hypothetical protein